MISLLIIMTIVVGMTASVGYTLYTFQRSAEIVSLAQRNAATMDGLASAIRSAMRVVELDGPVRIPFGEVVGGRSVLPSWAIGNGRTPWGAYYGWCPYALDDLTVSGPDDATSELVLGSDHEVAGAYPHRYASRILVDRGRQFVVRSDPPHDSALRGAAQGIVGLIVSPAPYQTAIPDCEDVRLVNGQFLVRGDGTPRVPGSVVPVIARGPQAAEGTAVGNLLFYVSPTGAARRTAVNVGEKAFGDTADKPLNLDAAISSAMSSGYRSVTISLAGGSYQLPNALGGSAGSVAISFLPTDVSPSAAPIVFSSGLTKIATDVTFVGADFENGAGLWIQSGGRARLTGGKIGYLRNDGGDALLAGTAIVGDASRPNAVELTAGRLTLKGTFDLSGVLSTGYPIIASGGELVLAEAALTFARAEAKPWMIFQQAHLSVSGPSTLDGIAIASTQAVDAVCDAGSTLPSCTVTCPALLYPVSASCLIDDETGTAKATLRSSGRDGERGWTCSWSPARSYALHNNGSIVDGLGVEQPVPNQEGALTELVSDLPRRRVIAQCSATYPSDVVVSSN